MATETVPMSTFDHFNQVKPETLEPLAKRSRFDWGESQSSSSGSSPSHSEDLHAELIPRTKSISKNNENSCTSDEGTVTEDDSSPLFVKREPLSAVSQIPMMINTEFPQIAHDSKFHSFAEFEEAFDAWKRQELHPFRVASSETLKEPDGTVNNVFRYRYVVYHCAHYGEPRMRGIGKRPNQSYLPCGCHAMLRLNYNFAERVLKITTLVTQHTGHAQSPEVFEKVISKMKSSPASSPAARLRRERSSVSSPLSIRNSPAGSQQGSPANGNFQNLSVLMQQQQLMAALMSQQKENMSSQYALGAGIARPTPQNPAAMQAAAMQNPAMLNSILNMMSMPFMQPAHGVVAQGGGDEPKATAVNEQIDVVNEFDIPANLPAPIPVRGGKIVAGLSPKSEPLSSTVAELFSKLSAMSSLCAGISDAEARARLGQLASLEAQWSTAAL